MSKSINWGILGTGRIAKKFAADLKLVANANLIAVGSRNKESADSFAKQFDITFSHESYESLMENKEVDVIYIATPHVFHYENTLLCLKYKKAVLCEKPFAMNKRQVVEMIETARAQDVFLMEALWTKFLPHYKKIMELIANETIGKVISVQANFGFKLEPSSASRLSDASLGGGTLLDIGIYNIFLALSIFGKPDDIKAVAKLSANGIDEQCSILFSYRNGATAQLFSTFNATIPVEANIFGTNGNIKLTNRFYEPSSIVQLSTDGKNGYIDQSVEKESGVGYFFEATHVTECLLQNRKESSVMRFEDSLLLVETIDRIRELIGLKYGDE